MKFFHVYNEQFFEGLVKNGLINEDTGFKLQHNWSMPTELKFNKIAARGGKLHKLITEKKYPFYIDRITGGTTYHKYVFDKELIDEYEDTLGEWFLGIQLHESASNRRNDWNGIIRRMDGNKGPYDVEELKAKSIRRNGITPDGEQLHAFAQAPAEEYAPLTYADTPEKFNDEIYNILFEFRTVQSRPEPYFIKAECSEVIAAENVRIFLEHLRRRIITGIAVGDTDRHRKGGSGPRPESFTHSQKRFSRHCADGQITHFQHLQVPEYPESPSFFSEYRHFHHPVMGVT